MIHRSAIVISSPTQYFPAVSEMIASKPTKIHKSKMGLGAYRIREKYE